MATELATAYVQIVPSAEGMKGSLTSALGGEASDAGNKAGNGFAKSMSKALIGGTAAVAGAAAGMTSALVSGVSDVSAYGDEVDKMSQKLGMSSQAYQEWGYVLELAGTDINSMTTGMKTLTNKLDDAKNGSQGAQEMFAQLGLSMEDLNSMSREDLFEQVVYGMQQMEDSTERAALANDLFGKSGQNLTPLFNQSTEATQEQIAAANELGMVMSEDMVKDSAAFTDSITTMKNSLGGLKNDMLGQFLPSMTQVTDGMALLFSGDVTGGMEAINEGVHGVIDQLSEMLPTVLEIGGDLVVTLAEGIVENLPEIAGATVLILTDLTQTLIENMPMIIQAGIQIILALITGLSESIPELIPVMIDAALTIVDALIENAPLLLSAGLDLIIQLAEGLIGAIPDLAERIPEIVEAIVNTLVENIGLIVDAGVTLLLALIDNLPAIINGILPAIPQIITSLVQGLLRAIPQIAQAGLQLFMGIGQRASGALGTIKAKVSELISGAVNSVKQGITNMASAGLDLVEGIWQGISDGLGWIKEKIRGWVGSVTDFLKNLFGISSPSKLMRDEIGRWIPAGIAEGITANSAVVEDAMEDLGNMTVSSIRVPLETDYSPGMADSIVSGMSTLALAGAGGGGQQINITLYADKNGAKLGEWVVNTYDEYKRRLG